MTQKSDEKSGKGFVREWSQSTGFVELGASFQGKFFQGPHLDLENPKNHQYMAFFSNNGVKVPSEV